MSAVLHRNLRATPPTAARGQGVYLIDAQERRYLDASSLEDVRAFHSTYYRPDNAVLIVVGDFEQQQLDQWVDKYFGKIAKPSTPND